jgi:ATP-binding cassette subfamily B protein
MDCGPAALKCLLEGFGIPVSYGRLREACQTDVDGTSIDTLEEVARQLGLGAVQVMLPVDHLLLAESEALPALLVVVLPSGFTHFLVVWRRHGPLVQVMDPGSGRRWLTGARLLREVYVHRLRVPAVDWQAWAKTEEFLAPLARRLQDLGLKRRDRTLIDQAAASPDWRALARLDAAVRLVTSLVHAKGVRRGREAQRILHAFLDQAGRSRADGGPDAIEVIPEAYWSVRPAPAPPDPTAEQALILRGAVLMRVSGAITGKAQAAEQAKGSDHAAEGASEEPPPLSPELAAALAEPPSRPGIELLRLLRGDGVLSWTALTAGVIVEASSTSIPSFSPFENPEFGTFCVKYLGALFRHPITHKSIDPR